MPDRDEFADEWVRLFEELVPPETPDRDGIAIAREGLGFLLREVKRHRAEPAHSDDQGLDRLERALELLLSENERYANDQQLERMNPRRHAEWRETVQSLLATIIEVTYGRITASEP